PGRRSTPAAGRRARQPWQRLAGPGPGLRRGGLALAVAPREALDPPAGVDQLLLARVERVALGADVDPQLGLGGPGGKGLAARTPDGRNLVLSVNPLLHAYALL